MKHSRKVYWCKET